MTTIQAIAIDLDGTLLGPDGRVSAEHADAVRRARAAGIAVVVATGRALVESRAALEAIGAEGVVVHAGGSMLSDAATGRTIRRDAMDESVVRHLASVLAAHDHRVLLLKDGTEVGYDYLAVGTASFDPASRWWFETLRVRVRDAACVTHDPHPHATVRVGAVAPADRLAPLAARLERELAGRCALQHWSAVTESHATGAPTHLLEAFAPAASKWTMFAWWCEHEGIDPRRTAAIGDGLNDVEIVREAGLGVAMANADPRVLAVAGRVAPSSAEHGVAHAIDRILEGAWSP